MVWGRKVSGILPSGQRACISCPPPSCSGRGSEPGVPRWSGSCAGAIRRRCMASPRGWSWQLAVHHASGHRAALRRAVAVALAGYGWAKPWVVLTYGLLRPGAFLCWGAEWCLSQIRSRSGRPRHGGHPPSPRRLRRYRSGSLGWPPSPRWSGCSGDDVGKRPAWGEGPGRSTGSRARRDFAATAAGKARTALRAARPCFSTVRWGPRLSSVSSFSPRPTRERNSSKCPTALGRGFLNRLAHRAAPRGACAKPMIRWPGARAARTNPRVWHRTHRRQLPPKIDTVDRPRPTPSPKNNPRAPRCPSPGYEGDATSRLLSTPGKAPTEGHLDWPSWTGRRSP